MGELARAARAAQGNRSACRKHARTPPDRTGRMVCPEPPARRDDACNAPLEASIGRAAGALSHGDAHQHPAESVAAALHFCRRNIHRKCALYHIADVAGHALGEPVAALLACHTDTRRGAGRQVEDGGTWGVHGGCEPDVVCPRLSSCEMKPDERRRIWLKRIVVARCSAHTSRTCQSSDAWHGPSARESTRRR